MQLGANATVGFACYPVVIFHNQRLEQLVPANHGERITERIARMEGNPKRAAAMAKARQRLGQWMANEGPEPHGLAALRLSAGLSQKQLAEKLGTQQSNISRWEANRGDIQLSTLKSLAEALGVTVADVIQAYDKGETAQAK